MRDFLPFGAAGLLLTCLLAANGAAVAAPGGAVAPAGPGGAQDAVPTATPIKHLVVIYNENVSFDHYFATYPDAANLPGEPPFTAAPDTPSVNNLVSAHLLTNNPNFTNKENGDDAAEPFRLDRTQAATADQNHNYTAEQQAYDGGRADLFPKYTGRATPGGVGAFGTRGQVMGYFDGNTVTALWNYAQHFTLSDNTYTDTYRTFNSRRTGSRVRPDQRIARRGHHQGAVRVGQQLVLFERRAGRVHHDQRRGSRR